MSTITVWRIRSNLTGNVTNVAAVSMGVQPGSDQMVA